MWEGGLLGVLALLLGDWASIGVLVLCSMVLQN